MELMGNLLSFNYSTSSCDPGAHSSSTNLQNLIPRLWPFLGHNICSVRKSSLQALDILLSLDTFTATTNGLQATLTGSGVGVNVVAGVDGVVTSGSVGVNDEEGTKSWLSGLLQSLLCQIFQRFLLEGDQENRELLHKVLTYVCITYVLD